MKIMTFNLKNDTVLTFKKYRSNVRSVHIFDLLKEYDLDIIGFQECNDAMFDKLVNYLPQYTLIGQSRSKKNNGAFSEYTCIAYKTDLFTNNFSSTFWLSKTPNVIGSRNITSIFPRICTMINLTNNENNQQFCIFNTHLDHLLPYNRHKEIDVILDKIKTVLTSNTKIILMGDMNTTIKSKVGTKILDFTFKGIQFKNAYQSNEVFNTLHFFNGKVKESKSPIDYIFVSSNIKIIDCNIITTDFDGLYPSDHFPVIANII